MNEDEVRSKWPLHWLVWNDDSVALNRLLAEKEYDKEQLDPRGRTPLHLAVSLGRVKCVAALLHHNANSLAVNRHHWAVLHEAVCSGNPELIGMVLRHRDLQQKRITTHEIPLMLQRLRNASDYYIEMKWEFSSWVPFVSRMCPSDTYKIWKKGTTVRVDTTLVGFEQFSWQRGRQTLIFQATESGHRVCDIDHDKKTVWEKEIHITEADPVHTLMSQEMGVLHRLNSPVVSTYLDTESITFQRQKSGIWGFRSEKVEEIGGYKAKVFTATGLDIVTNTRVEHLPETEKKKHKSINPLHDFLGAAHDHAQSNNNLPAIEPAPPNSANSAATGDGGGGAGTDEGGASNKPHLSLEEYFTEPRDKKEYDALGRPPEVSSRTQKLKATVCLAEGFPLSLQEQIMPIIDLMSLNTPHFAKVKDFVNLQMPSGFPIKFEIPLFHVMAAKVTFCNLNGKTQPSPFVSLHTERVRTEPEAVVMSTTSTSGTEGVKRRHTSSSEDHHESSVDAPPTSAAAEGVELNQSEASCVVWKEVCEISDDCFALPVGYRKLNQLGGRGMIDEEEELLQLAIRQSLLEQSGGGGKEQLSLTEALRDEAMLAAGDPQRQAAMRQSIMGGGRSGQAPPTSSRQPGRLSSEEEDLQLALALSQQMAEEEAKERRQRQLEEEEFEKVLRLSLIEK